MICNVTITVDDVNVGCVDEKAEHWPNREENVEKAQEKLEPTAIFVRPEAEIIEHPIANTIHPTRHFLVIVLTICLDG